MQLVLQNPTGPRRKQDIHYISFAIQTQGSLLQFLAQGLTVARFDRRIYMRSCLRNTVMCCSAHCVAWFSVLWTKYPAFRFPFGREFESQQRCLGPAASTAGSFSCSQGSNNSIFALQHSMALCQCIQLLHYKAITGWENKVFELALHSPCPWC